MRSLTIRLVSKVLAVLAVFLVSGLLVSAVLALFTNGGFEAGDFSGWTKTYFLNYGLTGSEPFTGESISRTVGGSDQSVVLGPFPTMSQADPTTGGNLKYPRFGNYTARVNGLAINRIANTLIQTSTVQQSDTSPVDGQIHVMFAYAPVLQDPGHEPAEQPYFYAAVRNVTRGNALLYEKFAFAGQSGVPWQSYTGVSGTIKYVDWQIVDIVPGASKVAVGDVVELEVIGADCALSAHFGYIYVDGFGSSVPSLLIGKSAPNQVYPDTDFAYTFRYQNNTGVTVNNVRVVERIPAKTSLVSVDPGCASTPGIVTCTLGTLGAGISGTFKITVHVATGAAGMIDNGDYYIAGDDVPALLGPLVSTPIVSQADLSIQKTHKIYHVYGITFTVVARNLGPVAANGAVVSDTMPANITNVTWTCSASGGAACTSPAGRNLAETLATFPAGGVVTYVASGKFLNWDYFRNDAEISVPAGITDPVMSNNRSTVARYMLLLPLIYHYYR